MEKCTLQTPKIAIVDRYLAISPPIIIQMTYNLGADPCRVNSSKINFIWIFLWKKWMWIWKKWMNICPIGSVVVRACDSESEGLGFKSHPGQYFWLVVHYATVRTHTRQNSNCKNSLSPTVNLPGPDHCPEPDQH